MSREDAIAAQERLRLFVAALDIAEEIADWAFVDIAALTPAPLDVERLARALHAHPPICVAARGSRDNRTHRRSDHDLAEAIAREYEAGA